MDYPEEVIKQAKAEIKELLIQVAQDETNPLISYSDLLSQITAIELSTKNPHHRGFFGQLLGEISRDEVESGKAMLSALVVHKGDRKPGKGFFEYAKELSLKKANESDDEFWIKEINKVKTIYKKNDASCQFFIEQYWPTPERDLSVLYMWFHEKKLKKNETLNAGDRVLFYETGHHPTDKTKGSKTLFASGTVLDKIIYIPKKEQLRGGKRWIFKREVLPEYTVKPEQGIPLDEIRTMLGMEGWPQSGFIVDSDKFMLLEEALKKRCEEINEEYSKSISTGKDFKEKEHKDFVGSGKEPDVAGRLAALEKAHSSHKSLLNKLGSTIIENGYEAKDNSQVDLYASIEDDLWVFEVKSTNETNYLSQVRHGIAQLYEYRYRYFEKKRNVKLCLVVQTIPPEQISWLTEYLQTLGIKICWPIKNGFGMAYASETASFLLQQNL